MKGMTFQQQYAVSFFEIATYCCQNETEVFSYIEYCGLEPKDYITGYLSNLQPYMIEHFPSQEKNRRTVSKIPGDYLLSIDLREAVYIV